MSNPNAVQVSLRALNFDRFTTVTMKGYVVGLAQRNMDGDGQLYVSPSSFRVRRDGDAKTDDDRVYAWDGDGELVFSTPLEGLQRIGLDLYFVRDNQGLRDVGEILGDALGSEGGKQLIDTLGKAARSANPAVGAIVAVAAPVARFLARLLEQRRDKVKVRAEGSLRLSTLQAESDQPTRLWGMSRADRGYFVTDWRLVELTDPLAKVVHPTLPDSLLKKMSD